MASLGWGVPGRLPMRGGLEPVWTLQAKWMLQGVPGRKEVNTAQRKPVWGITDDKAGARSGGCI